MIITCKYDSPQTTCKELSKVVEKNVGKVSCRPYNYRNATFTDWFVIPALESWPAYKHGKFFCDWQGDTDLLCGLLVEKGLGKKAELSGLYTSSQAKRWIMHPDWLWFRFLDDLKNGRVESAIVHIGKQLSIPVAIRFSGGYLDGAPDTEPYESLLKNDICLLQYDAESDGFQLVDSKPQAKLFTDLENVTTFNELVLFINKMNENDYLWLDILIGISLRYKDLEKIASFDKEEWDEEVIWDRFLKHFLPWFK